MTGLLLVLLAFALGLILMLIAYFMHYFIQNQGDGAR